ncbi:MAG: DUF4783 domain-containing protein, partial [Chitinophagaceae bacterium]|nr:DUF4783 domain-containing protein [Chitinophagaceae bacterium]
MKRSMINHSDTEEIYMRSSIRPLKKTKHILMKKYIGIAAAMLMLFLASFRPTYSIEQVLDALRTGNATQLAKYFDTRVDISLPNKSDNYS